MDSKRARLLTSSRRPRCSDRMLEAVSDVNRKDVMKMADAENSRVEGILSVPLTAGGSVDICFYHPLKLAQYYAEECPAFNALLQHHMHNEMKLVFYLDEVVPGDPLKPDIKNKFYVFYASFENFGVGYLFREEVWLAMLVVRTPMAKKFAGGVGGAVKALMLELHFGADRLSDGIAIDLPEGPTLLRASVSRFVADEAALKAVFNLKGAAGLRPCVKCPNIWSKNSNIDLAGSVTISCADHRLFGNATDTDVYEEFDAMRHLAESATLKNIDLMEKAAGMNLDLYGVFAELRLRGLVCPISHRLEDWPHCVFQSGTFNVEFHLLALRLRGAGINIWDGMRTLVSADWKSPLCGSSSSTRSRLMNAFSAGREAACQHSLRMDISEGIAAYPFVRLYTCMLPAAFALEKKSMILLCELIDGFLARKKAHAVNKDFMVKVFETHLVAFCEAYGEENVLPKHHFAFHVIDADDVAIDSLCLERKHKRVKAYAQQHTAHVNFEQYVLCSTMIDQRRMLGEMICNEFGHDKIKWDGVTVRVGDMIIFHGEIGILAESFGRGDTDSEYCVQGKKLKVVARPTPFCSEWALASETPVACVLSRALIRAWPTAWSFQQDGIVLALHKSI